MSDSICLQVYKHGALVDKLRTVQSVIKIGKLSSSHLRLDDDSVSRMHAVIENEAAGNIQIIDLGSTTGVVVNRSKVSKTTLGLGDEVQIGIFTVVVAGIGDLVAPGRDMSLATAKEKLRNVDAKDKLRGGAGNPKGWLSKLFGR